MKFTIGTIPNSIEFKEVYNLIKSSLLYADDIELIGMLEYTVFKYLPNRIDSVKDFETLMNSMIPILKSVEIDGSMEIISQMEDLRDKYNTCSPHFKKRKNRSSKEIIAQMKMNKLIKEGKDYYSKVIPQFIATTEAKEVEKLVNKKIISVYDYENDDYNLEVLTGGYLGNLIGIMRSGNSFPLFDKTSNDIISTFAGDKMFDTGKINQEVLNHAGIATNILMTLPTLEKASIDEILDFKKEMSRPLANFRSAIYSFSETVKSKPWDQDFQSDCAKLYYKEVLPRVEELNELSSDNSVLKNMGKQVLRDEEIRKKAAWITGGLVTTVTTSANLIGALDAVKGWLIGLSMLTVAPTVVSTFLKTLSMYSEAKEDVKKIETQMRGNSMYYYYKASKDLGKNK